MHAEMRRSRALSIRRHGVSDRRRLREPLRRRRLGLRRLRRRLRRRRLGLCRRRLLGLGRRRRLAFLDESLRDLLIHGRRWLRRRRLLLVL